MWNQGTLVLQGVLRVETGQNYLRQKPTSTEKYNALLKSQERAELGFKKWKHIYFPGTKNKEWWVGSVGGKFLSIMEELEGILV